MPYICLSRSDIPDGTIQVLDLLPNASQVIPATGGYPQTCYVNRALNESVSVTATGALGIPHVSGLQAYLVDRVEPGGNEVATATVTAVGPLHGDTITLPGCVLTATANYAVGTITCNGPTIAGPDTVVIGATTLTCVENRATGTATMASPVHGDTIVIKGVTFTATENFAAGMITIKGGCVAGDRVTIKGIVFMAGLVEDLPGRVFLDVATAGSVLASAASLILSINEVTTVQPLFLGTVPLLQTVAAVAGGVAGQVNLLSGPTRGLVGQFLLTENTATVRIEVSGAAMVAAVPLAASQQFAGILQAVGGTNIAVASSLVAAVNDATPITGSQALLIAAPAPAGGATCAAANGGTATVTLTADATHPGAQGDFALAQTGGHITLPAAAMAHTDANAAAGEFNSLRHFAPAGTNDDVAHSLAAAVDAVAGVSAIHAGALVTATADARGIVGQLVWTESTAGVRFTISAGGTLVMTAPNPAIGQFAALAAVAGGNADVATSLRAALTDATPVTGAIALMQIATGGPYITAAAPVGAVLTMTARDAVGAIVGPTGNMTMLSSATARLVPDAVAIITAMLNRVHQFPTTIFCTAAAAGLLARVDAGSALALTNINAVLQTNFGAELTGVTSNSTGTVADVLSILAGREYRVNQYTTAGVLNQYMNAVTPGYLWAPTARGSFTEAVLVNGTTMNRGEIRPATIGGDTIQREYRPIRNISDTDSFQISLAGGTLAVFADVTGMAPVTLWPDSDRLPYFPWSMQGPLNTHWAPVTNARVLTVYDDNGNVLA